MLRRNLLLRSLCAVALFTLASSAFCAPAEPKAEPYKKDGGPFAVDVLRFDWHDAARDRSVPVKIYFPKTGDGPSPVIVFSHGLGGSREGYEYLGRRWASWGYVSVHLQHIGSDNSVWKDLAVPDRLAALRDSLRDPSRFLSRPGDVSFVIDQLAKIEGEAGPLKGRLDMGRLGMAGHSMGAWTTLAVSGVTFATPAGKEISMVDPRIKAAIAMSPGPNGVTKDRYDKAFSTIRIPCLHMTGTLDESPVSDTTAADRRIPYDHISAADQLLVTFNGGDHMVFSGRFAGLYRGAGFKGDRSKDMLFQDLILQSTTAFWDTYLQGDAKARGWLTGGAFNSVLDDNGTLEMRLKASAGKGLKSQ